MLYFAICCTRLWVACNMKILRPWKEYYTVKRQTYGIWVIVANEELLKEMKPKKYNVKHAVIICVWTCALNSMSCDSFHVMIGLSVVKLCMTSKVWILVFPSDPFSWQPLDHQQSYKQSHKGEIFHRIFLILHQSSSYFLMFISLSFLISCWTIILNRFDLLSQMESQLGQ